MTDDFEQEWDELDEKVILAQILAELQQIRLTLQDAETGPQSDSEAEEMYRCQKCLGDVTVPAGRREAHAHSEHTAPPGAELSLFVPADQ